MNKYYKLILIALMLFVANIFAFERTSVFLWPSTFNENNTIDNVISTLKSNEISDVFVLVKGEAGATYYPSEYTYADYFHKKAQNESSVEKKEKLFQYYEVLKDTSLLYNFVELAHKNNIKVHAWFIVSGDEYFIKNHPGSEVVHIQNDSLNKYPYPLTNDIHVNLMYPGYKEYFLSHVKKALNIPFDGIMLDKIRYTHLAYTWDNINTSQAVREGVNLNAIFDKAFETVYGKEKEKFIYEYRDNNKDVKKWIEIKKENIESYVRATQKIAKEKNIELSAAFMPEGAYDPNFGDVYYGQNYNELSKYLDFIVIMAYAKDFKKPATWLKMVVKNAQIRSNCDIWVAIQGYNLEDNEDNLVFEQIINSRIVKPAGISIFRFGSMDSKQWTAYQKGMKENISKLISEQQFGIIYTGGGTIRNCWLKSADAALKNEKIIPLLFDEKYMKDYSLFEEANFVLIPGGGGTAEANALGKEGLKNIERFVALGGGYIGICAGSYLPVKGYRNSLTDDLQIVNAEIVDVLHWNRGSGSANLKIVENHPIFEGLVDTFSLEYFSGPILVPSNLDLTSFKPLAIFKTDFADNGATKGDMINKTAILEAKYKKGNIILFSPHPELTIGKEKVLTRAMLFVGKKD